MQIIAASDSAYRLPASAPINGTLSACYSHALNITLENESTLTLLSGNRPLVADGFLTNLKNFLFLKQGPVSPVKLLPEALLVEDLLLKFNIQRIWRPLMCRRKIIKFDDLNRKIEFLRKKMNLQGDLDHPFYEFLQTAGAANKTAEKLVIMAEAFSAGNIPLFFKHCRFLLGLGPGSTPSGDDFIAGIFLIFKNFTFPNIPVEEIETHIAELLKPASSKTTALAFKSLKLASAGCLDELTDSLLLRLGEQYSCEETAAAAERVMRTGTASGYALTAGMIYALRLLSDHIKRERK